MRIPTYGTLRLQYQALSRGRGGMLQLLIIVEHEDACHTSQGGNGRYGSSPHGIDCA